MSSDADVTEIFNGWMTKRGKIRKSWKRRFFRLYSNGQLAYYKSKLEPKVIGHIDVCDVRRIRECSHPALPHVVPPDGSDVGLLFLETASRVWVLAPTRGTYTTWLLHLSQARVRRGGFHKEQGQRPYMEDEVVVCHRYLSLWVPPYVNPLESPEPEDTNSVNHAPVLSKQMSDTSDDAGTPLSPFITDLEACSPNCNNDTDKHSDGSEHERRSGGATDTHLGDNNNNNNNNDSASDDTSGAPQRSVHAGAWSLVGVADGHCGNEAAKFIKRRMPELLRQQLTAYVEPAEALHWAFVTVDSEFRRQFPHSQAGATACFALMNHTLRRLWVANAGDCRAILIRKNEAPIALSRDHKPTRPDERNRIRSLNGTVMDGRVNGVLAVSRAIGDHDFGELIPADPEIEVHDVDPDEDIGVLVACDGLWDVMSNVRASATCRLCIAQHSSGKQICRSLVSAALQLGTADNVSAVFAFL
ncbi:MAG: hypothetical protein MHM6MM_001913 [Cercozoa sp. M6MM]